MARGGEEGARLGHMREMCFEVCRKVMPITARAAEGSYSQAHDDPQQS
jgi:hypothetical protein